MVPVHYLCTHAVPGVPRNASCGARSGASSLAFSWEAPNNSQNGVIGYQVGVKELRHRPGTREVVQISIQDDFFTKERRAVIKRLGLG